MGQQTLHEVNRCPYFYIFWRKLFYFKTRDQYPEYRLILSTRRHWILAFLFTQPRHVLHIWPIVHFTIQMGVVAYYRRTSSVCGSIPHAILGAFLVAVPEKLLFSCSTLYGKPHALCKSSCLWNFLSNICSTCSEAMLALSTNFIMLHKLLKTCL